MDKILLTTGGTGGHIFPALAVAEELRGRRPGAGLLFVGSQYGPEGRLCARAGVPFVGLPVRGFLGRGVRAIGAAARMGVAVGRALARTSCGGGTGAGHAKPQFRLVHDGLRVAVRLPHGRAVRIFRHACGQAVAWAARGGVRALGCAPSRRPAGAGAAGGGVRRPCALARLSRHARVLLTRRRLAVARVPVLERLRDFIAKTLWRMREQTPAP